MNELTDDFNDSELPKQAPSLGAILAECFDQVIASHVVDIEAKYRPQFAGLEIALDEKTDDEAWAVYEEIDLLVATEKRELMRACFLAGLTAQL
jgi:hypothetical protein